jgi:arginine repressor
MAAATKPDINKSQAIRDYFKKNRKAHAKEVVTALGEKGITVTESHVYVVKTKLKLTHKRKAKEKAAATATANGTPAKVKKPASPNAPNKSQLVRDLLTENPKLSVQEVLSTLAAKGIKANKSLYYFVKTKMKTKKRKAREKVAKEMVTASTSSNGSVVDALTTIKQIKSLAHELGGMKKLKALVEALSE